MSITKSVGFLACICLGLLGERAIAQTAKDASDTLENPIRYAINFKGVEREYFVRLPKDFDRSQKYWGLVVNHGGGGNAKNFWLAPEIQRLADEAGLRAIVISPSFNLKDPNAQRFPILGEGEYLRRVLEDVRGNYKLYPKILITGYSRGGQFTHRFALGNPALVHACAPISPGSWTTPDGGLLISPIGEVEDPVAYLSSADNAKDLPENSRNLFEPRVAKVAGRPAASGAKDIPFLIMCGTEDPRLETCKAFYETMKRSGYSVTSLWPRTPHGGRNNKEYRSEFMKYPKAAVDFFLRATSSEKATADVHERANIGR